MTKDNGSINLPKGVYLNVREKPNFFSNIIGAIAPEAKVDISEEIGDWLKISYEGKNAYVFKKAVETTGEIIKGGISLNLNVPNDFKAGIVGNKPSFNCNAYVKKDSIPILNENEDVLKGSYTSKGDYITIIKDNPETNLTFIQYPSQSNNIYKQGWINSSYISDDYLEFRFECIWTNLVTNQNIYLFDNTISKISLDINSKYTLLYTVTNFNQTYTCILFKDSNNKLKIGFIPFNSGKLEFLLENYPYNISNGSFIGNYKPTVKANAIANDAVNVIDINGINLSNRKIEKGTSIAILQVFVESQKVLLEYYDKSFNNYVKGYVNIGDLHKKLITINENLVIWNNPKGIFDVFDLAGNSIIYNIPGEQTIQYLYSTKDFACILYNNHKFSGYPIQTGFVKLSDGKFKDEEQIIESMFTSNVEMTYLSQNDIVINANIESKNIFSRSLERYLILKNSLNDNEKRILSVPVNWYSEDKNNYSGLQAILTSEIIDSILNDTIYNLFIGFKFENYNIELPLENKLKANLVHNDKIELLEASNNTIYLKKINQTEIIKSGNSFAMNGYWDSSNYVLNVKIELNDSISKMDKIELVTEDSLLSILGTNVTWYSKDPLNYNGAQFIISPNYLEKIKSNEKLYINVHLKNKIYQMPITNYVNTNKNNLKGITYSIEIKDNNLNLIKY